MKLNKVNVFVTLNESEQPIFLLGAAAASFFAVVTTNIKLFLTDSYNHRTCKQIEVRLWRRQIFVKNKYNCVIHMNNG